MKDAFCAEGCGSGSFPCGRPVELNSESRIYVTREDETAAEREGRKEKRRRSNLIFLQRAQVLYRAAEEETRRVAVYYIFPLLVRQLMDRWK